MKHSKDKEYILLGWDSKLFGYRVAKIIKPALTAKNLEEILRKLHQKNVKLVYLSVEPRDRLLNHAAISSGGFLADKKVTFSKSLNETLLEEDFTNVHSYLGKHLTKQLLSLAFQSGHKSRYKIDKNFKKREFEKLYRLWMEKSLKGKIAFDVLVYVDDSFERGMITLEAEKKNGIIGLVAVDKNSRGQGIGKSLLVAAYRRFWEKGYKKIRVVTQKANTIACNFYQSAGFTEEKIQNVYHFWL